MCGTDMECHGRAMKIFMEIMAPMHLGVNPKPMTYRLIVLPVLLLMSLQGVGQSITGIVKLQPGNEIAPGVNVIEKVTNNGTVTDIDGKFKLDVTALDDTLVISFMGCITTEVPLRGRTDVEIPLKIDAHRDFFDGQKFRIYASSGVVHTPAGLRMELTGPAFYKDLNLKVAAGYQTNFNGNEFLNLQAGIDHLFVAWNYDQDLLFNYNNVKWKESVDMNSKSLQTNLNFSGLRGLSLLLGYSAIDFHDLESGNHAQHRGLLLGLGKWIGRPINTNVNVKASIYNGLTEYNAELQKTLKGRINLFARYYKVRAFAEISLGIGWQTTYYFPWQKRPRR